jgi:hypothetical protein
LKNSNEQYKKGKIRLKLTVGLSFFMKKKREGSIRKLSGSMKADTKKRLSVIKNSWKKWLETALWVIYHQSLTKILFFPSLIR